MNRSRIMQEIVFAAGLLGLVGFFSTQLTTAQDENSPVDEAVSAWASLGGLSEVAAGLQWVRVYRSWREKDAAEMERRLGWVVTLDPVPLAYWLNGARMIAFDVAAWQREAGRGVPDDVRQAQLERGLSWLAEAAAAHPDRSAIPIETAVLHWTVNRDAAAVERVLADALTRPDAPAYVGRLRAEMLRRLGRVEEARAQLELLRAESRSDPNSLENMILDQRLRELESLLQ